MKKYLISIITIIVATLSAYADEGMWLVQSIDPAMQKQMKKMGLKLSANQLYNEKESSVSDAIVAINSGMGSGSIISAEGLMITNHHVAYTGICSITTPEHNYLRDGFWAKDREAEIPIPNYSVQFLRCIIDVTDEANIEKAKLTEQGEWNAMGSRKLAKIMQDRYANYNQYRPSFEMMWDGKKSYIYFYEDFEDLRLVCAPPERLGAFGGDTDNWGWPQHKADFTIFRVYTDKNGKGAKYSADNIPLKASRYLKVGNSVKAGDFTMVLGYPGRTHRYMSSYAVKEKQEVTNPIVIDARHKRMDIIREGMERNDTVRVNYSNRYFSIANYADYAKWENICFRRFDVSNIRAIEEYDLQNWICADSVRKSQYGDLLSKLDAGYSARREPMLHRTDFSERWFGICEAMTMASRLMASVNTIKKNGDYTLDINDKRLGGLRSAIKRYQSVDNIVDRKLFVEVAGEFIATLPASYLKNGLQEILDKYNDNAKVALADIYDNSCCSSVEKLNEYLKEPHHIKAIMNDPLINFVSKLQFTQFMQRVILAEQEAKASVANDEKTYASLLYDFRKDTGIKQYPNANSTMRLTYGKVCDLYPRDGVYYSWHSTTTGYLEKIDATNHEFLPDNKMVGLVKGLHQPKQVDFLTNNDITGGNSGSPVINAKGEIIGLAFDGNRESMAGDVYFDPTYARCVCVDINYIMWIVSNYGSPNIYNEIIK